MTTELNAIREAIAPGAPNPAKSSDGPADSQSD